MADVFISYSRSDRRRIRLIAHALAEEGFSVWWDPELKPGAKWSPTIRRALERSLCVVTCWTKASVQSKWVLAETTYADGAGKLVPAFVETSDIPIPYNMLQAADLRRWKGDGADPEWTKLLQQVRTIVEARKRAAVAAPPPGEAQAMRAGAGAAADVASDAMDEAAHVYRPAAGRGAMGPRFSRLLLAGAVSLVVLTAGLWAASQAPTWLAARQKPTADAAPAPMSQASAPGAPIAPPQIEAQPSAPEAPQETSPPPPPVAAPAPPPPPPPQVQAQTQVPQRTYVPDLDRYRPPPPPHGPGAPPPADEAADGPSLPYDPRQIVDRLPPPSTTSTPTRTPTAPAQTQQRDPIPPPVAPPPPVGQVYRVQQPPPVAPPPPAVGQISRVQQPPVVPPPPPVVR